VRKTLLTLLVAAAALSLFAPGASDWQAGATEKGTRGASTHLSDDAASLEAKRQQLADKEAALKAKEEALRKLSAALDARVNELNAAKKGLEGALVTKKKQDDERYKKMIKIYKSLKSDEAGALLNKLDDKMVIEMLNQMDQKTAVKLIPFISQPRVLEWTRLNLRGN
jgi:flagellar protein FlbB